MPKYIDMDSALQAHPEFLNEQIDDHDKAIYAKGWNDCNSAYYGAIKELENQTVDLNKMVPHWISVKERLPEKHVEVLICTEDYGKNELGFANTAVWDGSEWIETWNRKESIPYVSHWMPLPAAPKEVQKDELA